MKAQKELSIGYFPGTDVLRFLCATGVIFHHATLNLKSKGIATFAESVHSLSGPFFLDLFLSSAVF
jgi:peptidoglycan/LPS O-acetylase OafA/YrhL